MNSHLALRAFKFATRPLAINIGSRKCIEHCDCLVLYNQTRAAGHAKWQNIASTKRTNDQLKCRTITRYVMMVRRAIVSNNRQADPKLNSKLADVLAEASKMNVPKATLERAIARAVDVKFFPKSLSIQGPQGSALIAQCETDNPNLLRREVKKAIKKFDGILMPDDSLIGMFQSRGFIRASTKLKDQREVDAEFAEEAAIIANAEEVIMETYPNATDSDLAAAWVFATDANTLGPCKGELEKLGLVILSHDLNLVPYRSVDFGPETYEKVMNLIDALRELDQVVEVFHNLIKSDDESE